MSKPITDAERDSMFEAWLDANYDSVLLSWNDHLSEESCSNSGSHVDRLMNSDKAFEEFATEMYHDYCVEVNSADRETSADDPDGAA